MSRKLYTVSTTIIGLFATATLVAGCGGKTGGDPQPTGGSDASSTASDDGLPANGAPPVKHPIDPAKYVANICLGLNQNSQSALQITGPGRVEQKEVGPMCIWHIANNSESAPGAMLSATVQAVTNLGERGLSNVYGNRPKMKVFEPLGEIGGFPAVIALEKDTRSTVGTCTVNVGVTNKLVFAAGAAVKPGGSADPCDDAKKVAQQMVQTISGGS